MLMYPKLTRTRKHEKRSARAAEKRLVAQVRPLVAERDGRCRLEFGSPAMRAIFGACVGRGEWAHLRGHKRSETRSMAPERRHSTRWTVMLCTRHHGMEECGEIVWAYRDAARMADGPMRWVRDGVIYEETE